MEERVAWVKLVVHLSLELKSDKTRSHVSGGKVLGRVGIIPPAKYSTQLHARDRKWVKQLLRFL